MMIKTLVIFANSVKHKQHCVAGKDANTKKWIRPVADSNGCELSDEQTMYNNKYGRYLVKPLQKMKIEFNNHAPLLHQPENYVTSDMLWQQDYKIERDEIVNYLDHPKNLWLDGVSNNDRVKYALIQNRVISITQSLYLVQVEDLQVDKSSRKAIFKYHGVIYNLSITDPQIQFFNNSQNNYYLTISLGEEFKGYCYKLVAAIL